ncbi:MAG: DNA starvation/stationary phase protection protein [Ilumatobacteraceae bacterium]
MATRTITKGPAKKQRTIGPKRTVGAVTSDRNASFTAPGISAEDGAQVVSVLQERLCALIELGLTLKHIHWNVVGPSFVGVHEMLDLQYAGVQAQIDATAERIATLGGVPNGLAGNLVANRSWDDYELGRADSQGHLGALDLVYRGIIEDHRAAIEATADPDPVTQDMLIGQTGVLEQYHWFVRSHLQDYAGGPANAGTDNEVDAARAAVRKIASTTSRAAKGTSTARNRALKR